MDENSALGRLQMVIYLPFFERESLCARGLGNECEFIYIWWKVWWVESVHKVECYALFLFCFVLFSFVFVIFLLLQEK